MTNPPFRIFYNLFSFSYYIKQGKSLTIKVLLSCFYYTLLSEKVIILSFFVYSKAMPIIKTAASKIQFPCPVSYTHLTLPTIYSV